MSKSEKLLWFKFTPSDWMMGKIQRCPEITQAKFMRLCCLYWNKKCFMSIEDAIFEIEKENFEFLVKNRVIKANDEFIQIDFLDEQLSEIKQDSKGKSLSGQMGNIKRWHPDIYDALLNEKINMKSALKIIAERSHPDRKGSQSVANKSRKEEIRKEEIRVPLKKETKEIFNFKNSLVDYGFDKFLISDWLKVRTKKRATNSETAFKGFIREIEKCKIEKNEVLRVLVENSWPGLKAEWINSKLNERNKKTGEKPNSRKARTDHHLETYSASGLGKSGGIHDSEHPD